MQAYNIIVCVNEKLCSRCIFEEKHNLMQTGLFKLAISNLSHTWRNNILE